MPLRRGRSRGHGHGPLPRLAGLLHRCHRRLPPASAQPAACRPRRALFQCPRGRRHHARLAGGPHRRAAAGRRPADPADAETAFAADPSRRVPHLGGRHGSARSLPAHQAHAARPASVALAAPGDHDPQTMGARRGDDVGARGRADARLLDVLHGPHASPHRGNRVDERRQAGHDAGAGLGRCRRPRGPGAGAGHRRCAVPGARGRGHPLPARAAHPHPGLDGHQWSTCGARARRGAGVGARRRAGVPLVASRRRLPADPAL